MSRTKPVKRRDYSHEVRKHRFGLMVPIWLYRIPSRDRPAKQKS